VRYTGSKNRIANDILNIVLKDRIDECYVEPFVGGCNVIDKVAGNRIGNDINEYLIEFYKAVQNGWLPPKRITKEEYLHIKQNKDLDKKLTLWAGICCSYGGKWFGGLLNDYQESRRLKSGRLPNHQDEAYNGLVKQVDNIKDINFYNLNYWELDIPDNSIIYCDPPYFNTIKYKDDFDTDKFWDWVRIMSDKHKVYVSEYTAPDDFECIWSKKVHSTLSKQSKFNVIEKLYIIKK